MIEIRRADPTDADRLTTIAHASKRHWGYPERWIAAWRRDLTLTPEFIRAQSVWIATREEVPVGFYALIRTGRRAEIEHLWVEPRHIGHGIGRALIEHAFALARSFGITTIDITSDPFAEPFYCRMGARRTGWVEAPVDGEPRRLPRLECRIDHGS